MPLASVAISEWLSAFPTYRGRSRIESKLCRLNAILTLFFLPPTAWSSEPLRSTIYGHRDDVTRAIGSNLFAIDVGFDLTRALHPTRAGSNIQRLNTASLFKLNSDYRISFLIDVINRNWNQKNSFFSLTFTFSR